MSARNIIMIRYLMAGSLIGLAGLGAVACSKPSTINPVDAERVRKIDATVEQMRKAYADKDPRVFQSLFMPIESLRKLEADIQRDFAVYERISLDFTIDRVMVEGADVAVYFHWQGQWEAGGEDQPLRERGHAVFRLVGHQNLTLSAVDGDAPFGMAGRRIQVGRPRER
jgi:hypothetical protein